jgi:uncharacterized protein
MDMDAFTFVLLRRGPRADEYSDQELEEIQKRHLAFLNAMHEQGHLLLSGPFRDQDDETKRGFCLYRTSAEDTKRLTEQDPALRAGRMSAEVMTWLTRKGALE